MSLLRRTRAEVTGAWRSLRYDLGRQPAAPDATGPDVTSTGMNTFSGALDGLDGPHAGSYAGLGGTPAGTPVPGRRPPRRAAAMTALGLLTLGGAAGAYLAVVNGLGSLLTETPAAADTFRQVPPAATAQAEAGPAPRIGTMRTIAPVPHTAGGTARAGKAPAPGPLSAGAATGSGSTGSGSTGSGSTGSGSTGSAVTGRSPAKNRAAARPVRTAKPARDCDCAHPPVPTPTAPDPEPSRTPSTSVPPTGRPSGSGAAGDPGHSAEPSETNDSRPPWRHRTRH